jgi:hypothetical protein
MTRAHAPIHLSRSVGEIAAPCAAGEGTVIGTLTRRFAPTAPAMRERWRI